MKLSLYLARSIAGYTDRHNRVADSAIAHARRHPRSIVRTAVLFAPVELENMPDGTVALLRMERAGDLFPA